MYEIINKTTGAIIGYVDQPRYIYFAPNGSFVQCDEEMAQGIAYQSKPYNLFNREPLDANFDTVLVKEVDGGEIIERQTRKIKALEEDLLATDEVAIDLYEHMANMDEVLISMYEEKEMI